MHIFQAGDTENIVRHLAVRDYLRAHEEARMAYAALKGALAARYPYDIEDTATVRGLCPGAGVPGAGGVQSRALGRAVTPADRERRRTN